MGDQRHPEFVRLCEDFYEAEFATGKREETMEAAKRHVLLRLASIALGIAIVILGLILMPLPGPGLLVVVAGVALLAKDVPWARRVEQRVRQRLPKDASGNVPRWMIFVAVGTTLVMTTASLVYTFVR
ncbi:MAG: hypothetical protein IT198_04230 [Acidimicrobiia bacterium]|nr:hypothetical protein [Acidimicrobiia bacterium]